MPAMSHRSRHWWAARQGLITVDKEGPTVRLIHFALQEYLSAHPYILGRPHLRMAEISLTYLNSFFFSFLAPYIGSISLAPPPSSLADR